MGFKFLGVPEGPWRGEELKRVHLTNPLSFPCVQEYPETCREPAFLSLLPIMPRPEAGIPTNSLRVVLSFPALLWAPTKGSSSAAVPSGIVVVSGHHCQAAAAGRQEENPACPSAGVSPVHVTGCQREFWEGSASHPGKAWIGFLGTGKNTARWLVCLGTEDWEMCTLYKNVCNVHANTSFHLITECTRHHESNIKPLTLNTT